MMETRKIFSDLANDIALEYLNTDQSYPWILGFSGGKDSTLVVHLVYSALLQISPNKRNRKIYIVSNDTLVESPLVVRHMNKCLKLMDIASSNLNLPIKTIKTTPKINDTFWTLLIGKGYPTPNRSMRWCTDRLKIKPTSYFIKKNISNCGAAIILLGVRKDESSARKQTIEKYEKMSLNNLSPHSSLKGAFVYTPISNLSTEDVWYYLGKEDPPWGGTHEELIQLYRDADGGECPMVLSKKEAPTCGNSSSRFGCWVCTVVQKDKSLESFANSGNNKLIELVKFRNWLISIRNIPEYRQLRRRNGKITYNGSKHIAGPFTLKTRKMILDKLLQTQQKYGEELISQDELDNIMQIWSKEIIFNMMGNEND